MTVSSDGTVVELRPNSWCWRTTCADGVVPPHPPEIGPSELLVVEFPESGWTFSATFRAAGDPCARSQEAILEQVGPTAFELHPVGPAGTYDVQLFGQGEGDVSAYVRWTTSIDGPFPDPEASAAILAMHDGAVDSYGVELSVSNLARTPVEATATITVTASGGETLTFDATRSVSADCVAEGTVYFRGPNERGIEAAGLGDPPFEYRIRLELDGVVHTASATFPDDVDPDLSPYVPLVFDPPLPAIAAPG
jgi:hypothetical protein